MTSRGQYINNEIVHLSGQKAIECTHSPDRTEHSVHSQKGRLEPVIQSVKSKLHAILNLMFPLKKKVVMSSKKFKN